jgi:thiaminase/transcriptional activator TenA
MNENLDIILQQYLTRIYDHPLLKELSDGSLDKKIYDYYLLQDNLYLRAYEKVLIDLAGLADNKKDRGFLLQCAKQTANEVAAIKYKNQDVSWQDATNACSAYIQFLKTYTQNNYAAGLSAVFPCFYMYQKIAVKLYPNNQQNPYLNWFDTYIDKSFTAQTQTITAMLNRIYHAHDLQQQKIMNEIIEQGCHLEWRFWDEAYKC